MGSKGYYDGPPLTEPALGRSLTADADHAYRTRSSAERQAAHWNAVLEHDPVLGPESGFRVGVAAAHQCPRRWSEVGSDLGPMRRHMRVRSYQGDRLAVRLGVPCRRSRSRTLEALWPVMSEIWVADRPSLA